MTRVFVTGAGGMLGSYVPLVFREFELVLTDIVDGTSSTLMLAEIAGRPSLYRAGKKIPNMPTYFSGAGGWGDATSGNARLYGSSADGSQLPGTCGINCSNDYGLYAFHPGGANVLFADGSVHFLGFARPWTIRG